MKKNYYSATATAAKITKVPVEVIRAGFRKGAKPTGNVLNAVIVARQLYNAEPSTRIPLLLSRRNLRIRRTPSGVPFS